MTLPIWNPEDPIERIRRITYQAGKWKDIVTESNSKGKPYPFAQENRIGTEPRDLPEGPDPSGIED